MTSNKSDHQDHDQEINDLLLRKQSLIDRINANKGKRNWLFRKMPMKATSVENLVHSTQELAGTFKAANSVVCPRCGQGILMCDKDISRNYPGKVEWWCSNKCDFKVFALPRFKSVREAVKAPAYYIAQERLANMTEDDINKIIKEHQYKSRLFRMMTYGFLTMLVWKLFQSQWFLAIQWTIMASITFLFALKWGYRAWQIKSKNVYLKHSPFIGWLTNAPKWFSLDWYDFNEEGRDKLQSIVDTKEDLVSQRESQS
jgi:ribosomal protein S27AE